jgi:hypothetical protein
MFTTVSVVGPHWFHFQIRIQFRISKVKRNFEAGNFFSSKIAMKLQDVQATGEAFSPQKRTFHFFLFLYVIFALLDPDRDPQQ